MRVTEVISINDGTSGITICSRCDGEGKVWTELEFGDGPSDSEQIICGRCRGTGRTGIFKIEVLSELAYNYNLGDSI